MSRRPLSPIGRATRPGVEWEYDDLRFGRDLPRSLVTRRIVDRAEYGGWELDRVRIHPDGTRSVVLRRRIIRAVRTA